MTEAEFLERYEAAMHAVQSAIAFSISRELGGTTSPSAERVMKHLRTGLNGVMADHGSLARLLVAKGVFTLEEYRTAIAEGVEQEAARAAAIVRREYGLPDSVTFA